MSISELKNFVSTEDSTVQCRVIVEHLPVYYSNHFDSMLNTVDTRILLSSRASAEFDNLDPQADRLSSCSKGFMDVNVLCPILSAPMKRATGKLLMIYI